MDNTRDNILGYKICQQYTVNYTGSTGNGQFRKEIYIFSLYIACYPCYPFGLVPFYMEINVVELFPTMLPVYYPCVTCLKKL